MSINIGKNYLMIATSIKVQVSTAKLGPRQLSGFKRMVKTGIITTDSPQALLAKLVRQDAGLGYLHIDRWRTEWKNVPRDCTGFFDRLVAAHTAYELQCNANNHQLTYQKGDVKRTLDQAIARMPNGTAHYLSPYMKTVFGKSSPLPLMIPPEKVQFEVEMLK